MLAACCSVRVLQYSVCLSSQSVSHPITQQKADLVDGSFPKIEMSSQNVALEFQVPLCARIFSFDLEASYC